MMALKLAHGALAQAKGGLKMPTRKENFTVKTGEKGKPDYQEAPGSVMLYSDEELGALVDAGLNEHHQTLLNQIVKIRAMDAVRLGLAAKSPEAQLRAALKANPELLAKALAMAGIK